MIRLRDRLLMWFSANPDEELASRDVAARWGVTLDQCRFAASSLAREGFVSRELRVEKESRSGRSLYLSAGPELLRELGK